VKKYDGSILINTSIKTDDAKADVRSLKTEMEQLSASAEQTGKRVQKTFDEAGKQTETAMSGLQEGSREAADTLQETAAAGESSMEGMKRQILQAMAGLKTKLAGAFHAFPAMASSAFGAMAVAGIAALSVLGFGVVKITGMMVKLAKKIARAVGTVAKALLSLGNRTKKTALGFGMLEMLFRSVVVSGFQRAVNAINSATKEGMDHLVQYSERANQAVSSLVSSLETLENGFAAAFEPVLTVVTPILLQFLQLVSEIVLKINQLLSALSGKMTFIKAVEVQKDYAESLKETSEETAEAAKETKKALAPFDDLLIIQTAAGKEAENQKPVQMESLVPEQMFETVEIDKDIQAFADRILDLFKKSDFSGIGDLLGEKINAAVSKLSGMIDWNNVGIRIANVVSRFVALFNSLISSVKWEALGTMIGKGINTVINTLYLLINGIDWVKLGAALASGLNGLVHEVDWEKFGTLLGSYIQMKIDALYGFVTTADWPAIGRALGEAVMGLVKRIDWARFGDTLGKTLSGAVSTAHNFIQTIDWTGLGERIAQTINHFFLSTDWEELGQTFSDFALGILDMIETALQETDWYLIGQDVGEFLTNIDWDGIFDGVLDTMKSALRGVILGNMGVMGEIGSKLWDGFTQGIQRLSDNPMDWINRHVKNPFMQALQSTFGINSGLGSSVLFRIGERLMDGLIGGISLERISQHITSMADRIQDGFGNVLQGVKNMAIQAVNAIIDALNKLKFDVPDWVPGIGGKSFGFNIKHIDAAGRYVAAGGRSSSYGYPISAYSAIPYQPPMLATGTVVPPRAGISYFGIGDNNHEPEVVSPLSTMKQALKEAMLEVGMDSGRDITVQMILNDRVFGQAVYKANNQEKQRVGVRMVSQNG